MQSPDGVRKSRVQGASFNFGQTPANQVRHSALTGPIAGIRPFLIALALTVFGLASAAVAQCPRCGQFHPPYDRQPVRNTMHAAASVAGSAVRAAMGVADEALAEVNARRARKGIYPYRYDSLLAQGALECARYRAQHRIQGHTNNDFAFLPPGANARAGGCAAWEPSWGWGSCCSEDRGYTYAGAAWVMGSDGKRYMQLFVR